MIVGWVNRKSMKYKIYEERGRQVIERIAFPRFKGVVTFNAEGASDIEDIEWIDDPEEDVLKLARLMRSAGEFLMKGHQIKCKKKK